MMSKFPIPTRLSAGEQRELLRIAEGKRVVEAGALLGYSTLLLASVASNVVSIDRHQGYGPSTLAPYMSNLMRFGNGLILPVTGEAVTHLPHAEADVAFLDLTGQEEITSLALAALHPSVKVVAVHDLMRPGCDGVERAIAKSNWRLTFAVDTLGVLVR